MAITVRERLRSSLPPKLVHTYRVLRHTLLWPSEQEMIFARRFLSRTETAVDVGANVGVFTAFLARFSKRVIAFEPNPSCVRHLNRVLPSNCEVVAKAASDKTDITTLRIPIMGNDQMDALATIETTNNFHTEQRASNVVPLSVECTSLDDALLTRGKGLGPVSFINIDAEGHEYAVLRGAEGLIAEHRPVLLVELEYRHGAYVEDVFAWLKERQYAASALINKQMLCPIDPNALRELQNEGRLKRRLAGSRHSGYVNNIFFLPEE